MDVSELAKEFFGEIERHVGPFDRPFQFHPFPFDAGGFLNFLTVGLGRETFVTYISWDLFGQPDQKPGMLGRYELLATCDNEEWCQKVLTNIGRQSLQEAFNPGDTFDIGPWAAPDAPIQGVVFEEAFKTTIRNVPCGLLRCIGVTRTELELATKHGVAALVERLKRGGIYPRTTTTRGPLA